MDPDQKELLTSVLQGLAVQQVSDLAPRYSHPALTWVPLRNASIAYHVSHLLEFAQSLQQLRACALYQWGQASLAARNQGTPFELDPPPESVFLKLIKPLKTRPLPAFVALGLENRPPAAFVNGGEEEVHVTDELFFHEAKRPEMITVMENVTKTVQDGDKLKKKDDWEQYEYKQYRTAAIAGGVYNLFAVAELLQLFHYEADLKWSIASAAPSISARKLTPRPAPPHLCHFLEALRAAATEAFPILGIEVEAEAV